jgi:sulfotransferase
MQLKKIFFQSSLPRSGSTLMQCILNNDSRIYAGGTDGSLELLFGARANFTQSPEFKAQDQEVMNKAFKAFCFGGLNGYCNALLDGSEKEYVCLKSRGWGVYRGFIETFYPNPKIICMVRDLKDVVASYEKIYRANQNKHDPVRNDMEARGTTVHKRVDEWMHPTNTIGRAVERLFEMIRLNYADNVLFIKYEDLCLHPKTQMIRLYDYLDLPYYEHNYDEIPQNIKEDDTIYGLGDGLHKIREKLEMKPSDAKAVLGADICDWLYNTYKWYYDKFGYKK